MKRFHQTLTAGAIATSSAFMMFNAPAMAFTVTQNNDGSTLLNALLGDTTGLSNFSISTTGDAAAFGLFNSDPFGLNSGITLSTGKVVDVTGVNTQSFGGQDLTTDFGPSGTSGDLTQLDISFDADSSVEKLFFQYVFGSEEFVEYGGTQFNDSFELLLNGVNLAKLSDGKLVTINNLVPDNTDPGSFHPDYINNPAGPGTNTKLDGFTKILTFEGLLNQNAKNTLSIQIKDVGDGVYDSAVFIKGGTLGTTQPPKDVPEPMAVLGLMAIGSLAALKRRKATVKA